MKKNYSKYGVSTIQLIQIGKFYELWSEPSVHSRVQAYSQAELLVGAKATLAKEVKLPIEQIASLLNMRIISPAKRSLLQMGFPTYSLTTHLAALLSKAWTVVVVDESELQGQRYKQRTVSQIYSPSCNLEECLELIYVMSIYSQGELLGITLFSAISGHSLMFPVYWVDRDKVARLLVNYQIKEVVIRIHSKLNSNKMSYIYALLVDWNLFPSDPNATVEVMRTQPNDNYLSYRYKNDSQEWLLLHIYFFIEEEWFNGNYQEYTLSQIFKTAWTEDSNQASLISLLGVLQFVRDRDPNLVSNLRLPESYNSVVSPSNLVLCNRSESQLNLLPQKGQLSLLNIIDCCSTIMGKRLLKFRLLNPITDYSELNLRYKEIATFKHLLNRQVLLRHLRQIKDLSSLHRQWAISASSATTLPPKKLYQIYCSYLSIKMLIKLLSALDAPLALALPSVEPLVAEVENIFQVNNLQGNSKDILHPTPELRALIAQKLILKAQLLDWAEQTSILAFKDTTSISLDDVSTPTVFTILSSKLTKLERSAPSTIVLGKRGKSRYLITSPAIIKVSVELDLVEEQISTFVKQTYNKELKRLYFSYSELFLPIESLISRLDVAMSGAIVSTKFNYTQPCLAECSLKYSRGLIETINMRHPLIEQLNTQEEYVAYDINLEDRGMLVFSVNGAGKSTLLRAIGVNIILAQAGMYVAADSFKLRPYHYLITRILGGDDLHKGQSAFEVEMRDLSIILKLASYNSLILGDEICQSTETTSGLAILAATIERLTASQASFVLSTHLHQVCSLIEFPVRYYHLSTIQRRDSSIIYERKLKSGPGPSQYGIEIMGHIIKDKQFYSSTINYRQVIGEGTTDWIPALPNTLCHWPRYRPSKYNTKVFIDSCEICGASAEAIHHIKPQSYKWHQINRRSNLVPVCSSCHLDIHKNKISILGWKKTPTYKKLDWVPSDWSLNSGTE
uniref:MutS-like protein n=1 Tax=Cornularia pabloi TaxID=1267108 RepID=UPI001FAED7A7|nr:MutS-like protein [Cornularia pabloi]UKP87546.1 MutS-like protein [Cornularia pabloi]